jgi:hypothetical protein
MIKNLFLGSLDHYTLWFKINMVFLFMLTNVLFALWKQEGERNYKRRFVKILEPLEQWVDKDSIILTDFTVDKGTLHNMGFSSVYQVSISDAPTPQNKYSNQNVMDYLRRIVPRMFQVCCALF